MSQIVKLREKIEWDGEDVSEIEIRRPKGKHLKKLGGSSKLSNMIEIASLCSDYTPKFFDELDGSDYMKCVEVVSGFLDDGL